MYLCIDADEETVFDVVNKRWFVIRSSPLFLGRHFLTLVDVVFVERVALSLIVYAALLWSFAYIFLPTLHDSVPYLSIHWRTGQCSFLALLLSAVISSGYLASL